MGRRAVGLAGWIAAHASIAAAEPDPQPTPAPPEVSWYGGATPQVARKAEPPTGPSILRGGAFVLGGVTYDDSLAYGRIDLGAPIPMLSLPRLRVAIVSEVRSGKAPDGTAARTLAVTPTLQYDWRLSLSTRRTEVVAVGALGLRTRELWIKPPDAPFWPSRWESTTAYALRCTAGVEYRAPGGLVVSFQSSLGVPLNTSAPPDARFMTTMPSRDVGVSLVAGYQLR